MGAKADRIIKKCIVDIVNIKSETLQDFVDAVAQALSNYEVSSVSLYSPTLKDEEVLELVATTNENEGARFRVSEVAAQSRIFFKTTTSEIASVFYISIKALKNIPKNELLISCIELKVSETCLIKRQSIRKSIIEQSVRSKDVNSFVHRLANSLKENYIYAEEISIFLCDTNKNKIYLSATTGEVNVVQKKDIFYLRQDNIPTATALRKNRVVIEDESAGFITEEFDANISQNKYPTRLYTRGFWPISLAAAVFTSYSADEISALGVIKISNLERHGKRRRWRTYFSKFDDFTVTYICEALFVLVQKYMQLAAKESDIAWLTHGIGANIDASIKFATSLRETLFVEVEENQIVIPNFTLKDGRVDEYSTDDLYYDFRELDYFLGDLHFQFTRVDKKSYEREVIHNFHADVLIPVLRLTPAIAAVNSKNPPVMPHFKKSGSLELPSIIGNREAFISVLRNLIENSVKYTKQPLAKIDVAFSTTNDFIVIDYTDSGIGIAKEETELVFMDGFRSVAARRMNNKGIGIGLSYSRDIVRSLGGNLECLWRDVGAHFRWKIRRAD